MDLKRSKNGRGDRNFLENGSSTLVGPYITGKNSEKGHSHDSNMFPSQVHSHTLLSTKPAPGLQVETPLPPPSESTDPYL